MFKSKNSIATKNAKLAKLNPSKRRRRMRMHKWPGCWKGIEDPQSTRKNRRGNRRSYGVYQTAGINKFDW